MNSSHPGRRRRRALVAFVAVVASLSAGCYGDPEVEESQFAPHWALTTRDVGGELEQQGSRGWTVNTHGSGVCGDDLFMWLNSRMWLGAPSEATFLTVGEFDVRSQVTQLRGTTTRGEYDESTPEEVVEGLRRGVAWCEQNRVVEGTRSDLAAFEAFGKDAARIPATGVSTFGFRAKLTDPWNSEVFKGGGRALEKQDRQSLDAWYQEVRFTVTSNSTLIVLAIQGPTDPTKEFDVQGLINTMLQRTQEDPPPQIWERPEPLGGWPDEDG